MLAQGGHNWILGTLLISSLTLLIFILTKMLILLAISLILLLLVCFFMLFFRDPERVPSRGIVAPADGRIISITTSDTSKYDSKGQIKRPKNQRFIRIATFMSVFNVHVNRAPISGKVLSITHKPGKFLPAYKSESKNNERVITTFKTKIGKIIIIQIAGILAQRIIPYIHPNEYLKKGQRLGIIQFGSRVDLILPKNRVKILVKNHQRVFAGSTTVAEII